MTMPTCFRELLRNEETIVGSLVAMLSIAGLLFPRLMPKLYNRFMDPFDYDPRLANKAESLWQIRFWALLTLVFGLVFIWRGIGRA